jgi:type IV pilus assembly protein PilE
MKNMRGFSLIELMVVVGIMSILVMIVAPSYMDSVRKANRTDAKSTLLDYAAKQELFFAQNNAYTDNVITVGTGLGMGTADSPEGYYKITSAACDRAGAALTSCFKMTATAQGSQASDTTCAVLMLNSLGQKTATSAECW